MLSVFARPGGVKTTHFADDSHYYIYQRLFAALRPSAPSMIAFLTLFIAYQLSTEIRYMHPLGLTLFDVFVVWLTWKEYGKTLDDAKGGAPR